MPTQMRASGAAAIVPTRPRPVHGVMRCGTRRSTPSVVPAQMLPSRSSKIERTASLDRPESTVVFSIVACPGSPECLTRHSPWPIVPTHSCRAIVQESIAAAGFDATGPASSGIPACEIRSADRWSTSGRSRPH